MKREKGKTKNGTNSTDVLCARDISATQSDLNLDGCAAMKNVARDQWKAVAVTADGGLLDQDSELSGVVSDRSKWQAIGPGFRLRVFPLDRAQCRPIRSQHSYLNEVFRPLQPLRKAS